MLAPPVRAWSHPNALGPKNYIQVDNADVVGFESADFVLTGNVLCGLGGTFSSVNFDAAEQVIVDQVQGAICRSPELRLVQDARGTGRC